jgi:hypothetical protein
VACEAVRKISNEALLAQIAASNEPFPVRVAAIERISDQSTLFNIAQTAPANTVGTGGKQAVMRLSDSKSLVALATGAVNNDVRIAAIDRLEPEDQLTLVDIARGAHDSQIREAAVKRLTVQSERISDHATLVNIAQMTWDRAVGAAIVKRLSDSKSLVAVATGAVDSSVGMAAMDRLQPEDQLELVEIARGANGAEIGIAAVNRLTDQALLADLAQNCTNFSVLKRTIDRLTDPTIVSRIAISASSKYVREHALSYVTDQSVLARIALDDKELCVRVAASERVDNPGLLAELAAKSNDPGVRTRAVAKIEDQELLAQIATHDSAPQVRLAALGQLAHKETLRRIATSDDNEEVRFAALNRLSRDLFAACTRGDEVLVSELLQAGASPTIRDSAGATPLACAACEGKFDIVRTLLKGGADPWARSLIHPHIQAMRASLSAVLDALPNRLNELTVKSFDDFERSVRKGNKPTTEIGVGSQDDLLLYVSIIAPLMVWSVEVFFENFSIYPYSTAPAYISVNFKDRHRSLEISRSEKGYCWRKMDWSLKYRRSAHPGYCPARIISLSEPAAYPFPGRNGKKRGHEIDLPILRVRQWRPQPANAARALTAAQWI